MRAPFRRTIALIYSHRVTLFGVALSMGIGASLFLTTASAIDKDAEDRFMTVAHTAQTTLNVRIKSYADVLRGTSSLFQTFENVSREQFHLYVQGLALQTEFPGIETVNFAKYLKDEERPAFEAAVREEMAAAGPGAPAFRILPPGRRPEYTVLTYIEAVSPRANRFGMDLQARATVAMTLAESRDTGMPSTSGTRVALNSSASGLAMRIPAYRPGMPLDTVAQRRAAYIGSVGIGFGVDRLVNGVLDGVSPALHLVVSGMSPDEVPGGPRGVYRRMVFFDNMNGKAIPEGPTFEAQLPIGISNHGWLATFRMPKSAIYFGIDSYLPWLAMLAGSVTTFLLYALYQTLSSSRKRAISLAEEMTHELRASEAKLQKSNEHLRRLAAHAEHIKEGERKRIAREIHDELGQNLLALRIEADILSSRTGPRHPRLHARARSTLAQIDATIKSVRAIINDLRPNVLDLGLTAAVEWQITEFRRRTGISCELILNKDEMQVSDSCATALFRILQESLTNVTRHACATQVRVELRSETNRVSMTVTDNGIGIHGIGRHKAGSFGLIGVEERIKILGGTFYVSNAPGGGAMVVVSVPVDGQPALADQDDRFTPAGRSTAQASA